MATRLYIASDLHAAEKAWRKFVNAIKLKVYKADVALLAGDLTGKAIVPIVRTDGDGRYETDLFGVHRTARGDEELAALQRDIADAGYYLVRHRRRRRPSGCQATSRVATNCFTGS